MGTISFNKQGIDPYLKNKLLLKTFIASIFIQEGVDFKSVRYIFCSDEYLLRLNQKYLKHNTLTDILTFNYSDPPSIVSEIYISIERVKDNARTLELDFEDELHRVMIHGILHLCGYNDGTTKQKANMRAKEDFYLKRL